VAGDEARPSPNAVLLGLPRMAGRIEALRPFNSGREVEKKIERDVTVFIGETERRDWTEAGMTAEQLTQQLRERSERLRAQE
jgi:hypothetical protein